MKKERESLEKSYQNYTLWLVNGHTWLFYIPIWYPFRSTRTIQSGRSSDGRELLLINLDFPNEIKFTWHIFCANSQFSLHIFILRDKRVTEYFEFFFCDKANFICNFFAIFHFKFYLLQKKNSNGFVISSSYRMRKWKKNCEIAQKYVM